MRRSSISNRLSLTGSDSTLRSREESCLLESVSQWELLMRKFADDNLRSNCKRLPQSMNAKNCSKTFRTGSKYEGQWNPIYGMTGRGTYTFPSGVVYHGEFHEGVFHGIGEMKYQNGLVIRGRWRNGKLDKQTRTLIFEDGLLYDNKHWKYCRQPDRRFTQEHKKNSNGFKGLKPGTASYMTAEQPSREIPKGFYDTGIDFHKEGDSVGKKHDDICDISRYFSKTLDGWTVKNCRKAEDEIVGPNKELYEEWWDCKIPLESEDAGSACLSQRDSDLAFFPCEEPFSNTLGRHSIVLKNVADRKNIKFNSDTDV